MEQQANMRFPMVFQESKQYALFWGIFFMAGLTLKMTMDASKHSGEFLQFVLYFLALSIVIRIFFGDISYEHHKNTVIVLIVFIIAIFAFIFLAIRP